MIPGKVIIYSSRGALSQTNSNLASSAEPTHSHSEKALKISGTIHYSELVERFPLPSHFSGFSAVYFSTQVL